MKCPLHRPRLVCQTETATHQIFTLYCEGCDKNYTRRKRKPSKRFSSLNRTKTAKKGKDASGGKCVRKKDIRRVSRKRDAQNQRYLKLRRDFLRDHQYCQVCKHNFSTQIHHTSGREGEWLLRTEHWLACCATCHERIETCRQWAMEMGYLKLRLTTDQLNNQQS